MKPKASEGEKPKWSDTATGYHFFLTFKKQDYEKV